jgi:hypothetical protein
VVGCRPFLTDTSYRSRLCWRRCNRNRGRETQNVSALITRLMDEMSSGSQSPTAMRKPYDWDSPAAIVAPARQANVPRKRTCGIVARRCIVGLSASARQLRAAWLR